MFPIILKDSNSLKEIRSFIDRRLLLDIKSALSHEITHVLFKTQTVKGDARKEKYNKLYRGSISSLSDKNLPEQDKIINGVFYYTTKNEVESFASQICSEISNAYETYPDVFRRLNFEELLKTIVTWNNIKKFYHIDVGDATTFDGKLLSRKQKDAKHKILNKAYNHWKSLDDK